MKIVSLENINQQNKFRNPVLEIVIPRGEGQFPFPGFIS
jgi:hypothetical protein